MQENVQHIGRCVGCGHHGLIKNDGCEGCYTHPKRGRKFIEVCKRVRREPEFALSVYNRFGTDEERRRFIEIHGLPVGAVEPAPKFNGLHLVKPETEAKVIPLRRV